MTLYGYTRVSSRGQATDGNSLQAQRNALALQQVPPDNIFQDVFTGSTITDRPQLQTMLKIIQPQDTLIVTALDRLARSTVEGLHLVQTLHSQNVTIRILNRHYTPHLDTTQVHPCGVAPHSEPYAAVRVLHRHSHRHFAGARACACAKLCCCVT
jgi:DNA invertase Pin-like site-specific DNA recombinase